MNITKKRLESVVDSLYQRCKPSVFKIFKTLRWAHLIKEIESITEPSAFYSFIPLMFVKNEIVSKLARKKIKDLLRTIPIHQFHLVDEKIRKGNFFYNHYKEMNRYWYDLPSNIIDEVNKDTPECLTCLKILSCHPNGYIRHKAIMSLNKINLSNSIPFIIIRLNDWVDHIRVDCLKIIRNLIDDEAVCHLTNYLPLLQQLKGKGRYDYIQLVTQIETALANKCSEALFSIINSDDIINSRYAFTIIANSSSHQEELLRFTRSHKDIVIKLRALEIAEKYYHSEQLFIYLKELTNDKLMQIRRNTLYAIIKYYPRESKYILENALFDSSRSIRNLSQYYLKQQGIFDFSFYYKNALKSNKTIKSAILGLSESGCKDDFECIRPFIKKEGINVTTEIIIAAFKLQPEDWKTLVASLLSESNPAALRECVNCILQTPNTYTFREVLDLIYNKDNIMSVDKLIKILTHGQFDRWTILNFVLSEIETSDTKTLNKKFEDYLHKWMYRNSPNKVFVRPTKNEPQICFEKAKRLLINNPTNSLYPILLANIKCFI